MALLKPHYPGDRLEDEKADYRASRKIDRYRLSEKAFYIPMVFGWSYIPLSEIADASSATKTMTAQSCAAVRIPIPQLKLLVHDKVISFPFDNEDHAAEIVEILANRAKGESGEEGDLTKK